MATLILRMYGSGADVEFLNRRAVARIEERVLDFEQNLDGEVTVEWEQA